MLNEKVTIQDIADKAGVSISTVSRVLSGTARVSSSKRHAVLQAADELDYRPNVFARGLASGQSMSIGVLTQNFGSAFFDGILRGIIDGLDDSGYFPLFDGRWRQDVEEQALQSLLDQRVDGLILIGSQLPAKRLRQIEKRIPLVIVSRQVEGLESKCVFVDNFDAGLRATKYLLDRGHRHIAHLAGILSESAILNDARQRLAGYHAALQMAGIEPAKELLFEGNYRSQSGLLAIEALLLRGTAFSAIFAANDQMAAGARLGLYRRGIRVPDDVSLIGFDDQPHSAYMVPPLTTIRQPAEEMGMLATEALLNLLKGESIELPRLQVELVMRESVKTVF